MEDSAWIRESGSAASRARANPRCRCRSPTFEPRAMYATSDTARGAHAFDPDLGEFQGTAEGDMGFADGDGHAKDPLGCNERRGRDPLGDIFEILDVAAPHDLRGTLVQPA